MKCKECESYFNESECLGCFKYFGNGESRRNKFIKRQSEVLNEYQQTLKMQLKPQECVGTNEPVKVTKVLKLYKIPLFKRTLDISNHPLHYTCMHIDNVGMFIGYNNEDQLTTDYLRRFLTSRESTWAIVEAYNVHKALEIFNEEWEGVNIGGEGEEHKALWIDKKQPIMEIPYCMNLHYNCRMEYICGPEEDYTHHHGGHGGERGMCVLEGYDAPEDCILSKFYDDFYDGKCREKHVVHYGRTYKLVIGDNTK